MVTPAVRREAIAHLRSSFKVSERRACTALGVDRTSVRYRRRRLDDPVCRARLRELASVRRRFGYRRLHVLMCREGLVMNHKKFRRLSVVREAVRECVAGMYTVSVSPFFSRASLWLTSTSSRK
jgi:hypothetical protein